MTAAQPPSDPERRARHRRKVRNYRARLWRRLRRACQGGDSGGALGLHFSASYHALHAGDPVIGQYGIRRTPLDTDRYVRERIGVIDRASAVACLDAIAAAIVGAARGRHFRRVMETGLRQPTDEASLQRALRKLPIDDAFKSRRRAEIDRQMAHERQLAQARKLLRDRETPGRRADLAEWMRDHGAALPVRALGALAWLRAHARAGEPCRTIGDVADLKMSRVYSVPNCGRRTVAAMGECIEGAGVPVHWHEEQDAATAALVTRAQIHRAVER